MKMFQEADISVTTSPAVATSAAVITSAAATSAVTAAPIQIINDEVIRPASIPNGSILRGLLTKDATSAGEEQKVNLLEGLGDDFLNQSIDEQTIALIIEEIAPAENATTYNEFVEQNPTSSSETGDEHDDDIILGLVSEGKRKHTGGCGGKGAKIFKPLMEKESAASFKLFSQPEQKVLMRDYQNLIAQVEEQKSQCEERKRESQRMLTSLSSRREEAEVQQKKFQKIQDMIQEQRKKCREDEDMLMALLGEETRLMAEKDRYHEQLHWFDRRLLALRVAAEDP